MMRGLTMAMVMLAVTTSATAQSTGIRDVTASDSAFITLNTQLRFTTLIVLPDGEEIVEMVCGDKDNWVLSMSHHIAHVKPTKEKSVTNLNLVATSGTIYSFLLKEGSGTGIVTDLRVNVSSNSPRLSVAPKYYTAETVDALRADLARVKDGAAALQVASAREVSAATAQAPLEMQFPYTIQMNTEPFLVRAMWHDGTFTYLRTDAQELPALYELKDDDPALVQFEVKDGVYVVNKILGPGYLQLGKKSKLPFQVRPAGTK